MVGIMLMQLDFAVKRKASIECSYFQGAGFTCVSFQRSPTGKLSGFREIKIC